MDEKQYIHIIQLLTEVQADVKGVHRRQDITNGRLAKNEEKVIEMDKTQVSILGQIQQIVDKERERSEADKERSESDRNNKQYWIRLWIERTIWFVLGVLGIALTKLGIISLSI